MGVKGRKLNGGIKRKGLARDRQKRRRRGEGGGRGACILKVVKMPSASGTMGGLMDLVRHLPKASGNYKGTGNK